MLLPGTFGSSCWLPGPPFAFCAYWLSMAWLQNCPACGFAAVHESAVGTDIAGRQQDVRALCPTTQMSALGQKRTFRVVCATSALPPKARFQRVKLLSPDPSKYTFAFPLTRSPRWAFGRQQQIFIHE
jgi:hypothetical protein